MNGEDALPALLDGIGQGDESSFRCLYEQTKSRVFTLALRYVRNTEDAEEITQDVFIDVFRSAQAFRGESGVLTWLYRITVNKSLDFQKRQKRQKRFAFLTSLFDSAAGHPMSQPTEPYHPGVALEDQERAAVLHRAIDKLPEKQRTVYILTRIEGLTNPEAASILTTSVGAVESLQQRALANLRKDLTALYDELNNP